MTVSRRRSITTLGDFVKIYNSTINAAKITKKNTVVLSTENIANITEEYGISSNSIRQYISVFRRTWNIKDAQEINEEFVLNLTGTKATDEFSLKAIKATTDVKSDKKSSKPKRKKQYKSNMEFELNKQIREVKYKLIDLEKNDLANVLEEYLDETFPAKALKLDFLKSEIDDIVTAVDKYYVGVLFGMLKTGDDETDPKIVPSDTEKTHEVVKLNYDPENPEPIAEETKDGFDLGYDMIKTVTANMKDILTWTKVIYGIETIEELEHAISTYKKAIKIKEEFEAIVSDFDK